MNLEARGLGGGREVSTTNEFRTCYMSCPNAGGQGQCEGTMCVLVPVTRMEMDEEGAHAEGATVGSVLLKRNSGCSCRMQARCRYHGHAKPEVASAASWRVMEGPIMSEVRTVMVRYRRGR